MLFSTCEDTREKIHKVAEVMKEELQKVVEGARDKIYKVTEELSMAVSGTTTMDGGPVWYHAGHSGRASYVEVLGTQLPLVHPNTLTRTKARERQVLIDKDPLVNTTHLEMLTEHKLITKANEAISKVLESTGQGPKEARAVGAKKLQNGGVVLELSSPKSAQWMWKEKATLQQVSEVCQWREKRQ